MLRSLRSLLPLALLALGPPMLLYGAASLTPEEERGRQIYLQGTSPSGGEIVALMGDAAIEVPASAVPCGSCHGADGRGRPEGGVSPSDLRWESLTKPYGVTHPSGRKHPAYDDRLLKRAVTMGIDPAGNKLHVAMPRFRMSLQDMADLTAYMKKLGREAQPGVSDTAVGIGVVLPPAGPLSPMGRAVRAALEAQIEVWNGQGGFYGRRIEPRFLEPPADPAARREAVAGLLDGGEVFAVAAAFLPGADAELTALFTERQVPLIGPFTLYPQEGSKPNRHVFYLLPGMGSQGRALVHFARTLTLDASSRPAVAAPADAGLDAAVLAITQAWGGQPAPTTYRWGRSTFDPAATARELAATKADPVFFLGSSPEAGALLRAAEPLGWRPHLLLTGAAADPSLFALPPSFDGRIFVALPAMEGAPPRPYQEMAATRSLPREHLSAQLTALAAAEVLGEALRRTGRELTRERLIEQLEGLRKLQTAYAPPVTYGPLRRIGANGAYVLKVDLAQRRLADAGGWVEGE